MPGTSYTRAALQKARSLNLVLDAGKAQQFAAIEHKVGGRAYAKYASFAVSFPAAQARAGVRAEPARREWLRIRWSGQIVGKYFCETLKFL